MKWASLPKKERKKKNSYIYTHTIGKRSKTWMTEFPPKDRRATACTLPHSSTASSEPSAEGCASFIAHPLFLT